MASYSSTEARAKWCELVRRAAAGEEIEIRRRGRPAVRLVAAPQPVQPPAVREPLDVDKLRELTDGMKLSRVSGVEILREMRDSRD